MSVMLHAVEDGAHHHNLVTLPHASPDIPALSRGHRTAHKQSILSTQAEYPKCSKHGVVQRVQKVNEDTKTVELLPTQWGDDSRVIGSM